jgi:phenylpropionate dioxygenase-like ring-hydroxylating dioxygenase large terminal subunit
MASERAAGYRKGLVDPAAGQISREIFVNDEIYREELERVFARSWLFVGHESQIPNPGDFFVSAMGEESVILCRDRAGQIHVFLNSCRHRGMKVCRYDEGSTAVFTCPYHGWSYSTDGRLVGVPISARPIARSSTALNGAWSRSRNRAITRARSGRLGIPRRHLSANISAGLRRFWI